MTNLEQQIKDLPRPYVVMGVGVPGSGKTTVLKEMAKRLNVARICPDEIREELTGNQTNQSVNVEAWTEANRRLQAILELGQSAILDATNYEAYRRPIAVELYRSFGAITIVAVMFNVPLEVSKQRNSSRDRVVPDYVLERMHKALITEPVSTEEGFDEVIAVNI